MKQFDIQVRYDENTMEVDKIAIVGGYVEPSLEMTDLINDVIYMLKDRSEKNWNGYMKKVGDGYTPKVEVVKV